MAKYEDQLERMNFLMEYKNPVKETRSNIEYHANGADGKVYGILKEGTKYYIKETESGKENIAESYEYIGGFINRRDNEFTDYNKATKQLELKLMSLNEAYGKKEKTSTFDGKRTEKVFMNLTEEARKELDRMNEIFENSNNIGRNNIGDPESKGKSTGDNTTKNNEPFSDKVTPDMAYKGSKGTVDGATDNKSVSGVEEDLKSDKMKSANSNLDAEGNDKANKDAHDDLDGDGVADKSPKGAKAVKMNEGMFEAGIDEPLGDDFEGDGLDGNEDITADDFNGEGGLDMIDNFGNDELGDEPGVGDDLAGVDSGIEGEPVGDEPMSDDEFDQLLEEFTDNFGGENADSVSDIAEGEGAITGPDKVLDKEGNPINGTNNGVDGETDEKWKRIEEAEGGNVNDPAKEGDENTLKNYQYGNNSEKKLPAQSWDKMKVNEAAVKALTDKIFKKLTESAKPVKKKETLEEAITRIVKEEITKLDAWGKHPRYQKEPMTTPANKEVMKGTADRDINDDSAKGEEPYGKKIGSGAPFTKETVDLLTDQVMAKIKSQANA